ncbi:MAG TPA: CoA pyrophosphatase [Anaerolineales bacterium]|nr:CoA pyrophosphatase [Anaerolineales bacterium]HNE04151.1 CoA pyrophosphatase [Anaerolineales bacterium]HNF93805.1 CoA pyrophosphatase [Anaerolineales bacterium]
MTEITEEYIWNKLNTTDRSRVETDGYAEIPIHPDVQLKCAAVLVPLVFFQNEWHVLYTRRTDRVESHKGQVSFPGGACDEGETTPEETALREADEEIGLNPKDVKVIGKLSRMVTISKFKVTPVVGIIPFPYAFKTSGAEVARVFTMPLLWLANRNNYWEFSMPGSGRTLLAYHPYDGELLWGATARMTVNFLSLLDLL